VDIQNHHYGHASVMARHAGLSRPRHVRGLLQHGWTVESPMATHFADFPDVEASGRRELFVWTHHARGWDPAEESRRTRAVGAPWAYLVADAALDLTPPGEGTLIFPLHGSHIDAVVGDQAALARYYAETEGPCTISVHVEDLGRPEVIEAWTSAGHTLVSAGARGDVDFLPRILAMILRHRRVVSNRLMTSILYAASIGREVAVHGDPLSFAFESDAAIRRIEDLWPELHGSRTDGATVQAIARDELGFQHVLPARELREAFGWARPMSPGPAFDYWLRAPLQKALNVVGVGRRDEGFVAAKGRPDPMLWLRHPLSHLPRGLPRRLPQVDPLPEPLRVGDTTAAG